MLRDASGNRQRHKTLGIYPDLSGRPHWCSISSVMRDILAARQKGEPQDKVFRRVAKTGVQVYLRRWCEREHIEPPFTPHDLRRTCATRMNEIGVGPHIVERILNHRMAGGLSLALAIRSGHSLMCPVCCRCLLRGAGRNAYTPLWEGGRVVSRGIFRSNYLICFPPSVPPKRWCSLATKAAH